MVLTRKQLLELLQPYRIKGDNLSNANKEKLLKNAFDRNLIKSVNETFNYYIKDNLGYIFLNNRDSKIKEWATIDKNDYEKVIKYKWHISKTDDNKRYVENQEKTRLHKFILGESQQNLIIDHINSNSLDNRRENLRFVTRQINSQNRIKDKNKSSQYYGVCKTKWGWCSKCSGVHLGYFEDEICAAYSYDLYVIEKFNGQGKINDVDKPENFVKFEKKKIINKGIKTLKNGKFQSLYWDKNKKKMINLGIFEKLEEAINTYNSYCTNQKLINERNHSLIPIVRDNDKIAIIPVKNKNDIVYTLVDDKMWHEFMKYKWCVDSNGYVISNKRRMHSLVLNTKEGQLIDHIHNKLDNRINSLRITNYSVNNHNKKPYTITNMKGVGKAGKKFRARVTLNKKEYLFGNYTTIEIAAYAYDCGAKEVYGDNARINNVRKPDNMKWSKELFRLIDDN